MERYRDVGGCWRKDNSNYIRSAIALGTDNIAFPAEGEREKTRPRRRQQQKQAHKGGGEGIHSTAQRSHAEAPNTQPSELPLGHNHTNTPGKMSKLANFTILFLVIHFASLKEFPTTVHRLLHCVWGCVRACKCVKVLVWKFQKITFYQQHNILE